MKKQSRVAVLFRMIKLVKPLTGFMILAVVMGTLGFLCAQFIPVLGGMAIVRGVEQEGAASLAPVFVMLIVIALLRAILKFAEQRTNHYIAFTLLAIIRTVFRQAPRLLFHIPSAES